MFFKTKQTIGKYNNAGINQEYWHQECLLEATCWILGKPIVIPMRFLSFGTSEPMKEDMLYFHKGKNILLSMPSIFLFHSDTAGSVSVH